MSALPRLRRGWFFAKDSWTGGTVAAHIREIEAIVADPMSADSLARRERHLVSLLDHAVASVPFYRDLGLRSRRLEDFPVMPRSVYQERTDQVLSASFDASTLPHIRTSGSSGMPLRVPRDSIKQQRHLADLIAFIRLAGYDFGDPVVFLSTSRSPRSRRDPRQWMQAVDVVKAAVFDQELVEQALSAIENHRTVTVMGAPSGLEFTGLRLQEMGRSISKGKVRCVLGISEALTPWLRVHGEEIFGGPVLSRYSNEENGILAQQTPHSEGRFIVNHASYVVELLAEGADTPVAPGEVGRIVITDLFAHAMPQIRYDTGDLGRWSAENPAGFVEVVGRRRDTLLDEDGRRVAPSRLSTTLFGFTGIRRYQLAQTGRHDFHLRFIADVDPARDAQIHLALSAILGPRTNVTVEYVDDIDPLPSGKRRPIANLWAGDDSHTLKDLGDVS